MLSHDNVSFSNTLMGRPYHKAFSTSYVEVQLLHSGVLQLTWTANCLRVAYGKLEFGSEHTVSYLPLSHMAAQVRTAEW
jgi:hypothetical protein